MRKEILEKNTIKIKKSSNAVLLMFSAKMKTFHVSLIMLRFPPKTSRVWLPKSLVVRVSKFKSRKSTLELHEIKSSSTRKTFYTQLSTNFDFSILKICFFKTQSFLQFCYTFLVNPHFHKHIEALNRASFSKEKISNRN